MANNVLDITDFRSSMYDRYDLFHDSYDIWKDARGNVLHSARSFMGKSDTLPILHAGSGMRVEIEPNVLCFCTVFLRAIELIKIFSRSSLAAGISTCKLTKS